VPKEGRAQGITHAGWRADEHPDELIELEDEGRERARAQMEGFDDDGNEEEEAPTQLALPFDLAFHSIHHDLLWMLAALGHNQFSRNIRFVNLVCSRGAGFFRLVADLRDLQERTDQPNQPNPRTWAPRGIASLGNFRTMQPDQARTLRQAADTVLEIVRRAV
jgi:hypothetical protein